MTEFLIIQDSLSLGLKSYFALHKKISHQAAGAIGLQLLNNIVNGSPNESVVPPILEGHLRGSGSVFVGDKFVGDTSAEYPGGEPNRSHSDDENTVTVGFDAPYTAKLHEGNWEPGPVSEQSGDVGNKFVEKHMTADKEELMALYAAMVKKGTGA